MRRSTRAEKIRTLFLAALLGGCLGPGGHRDAVFVIQGVDGTFTQRYPSGFFQVTHIDRLLSYRQRVDTAFADTLAKLSFVDGTYALSLREDDTVHVDIPCEELFRNRIRCVLGREAENDTIILFRFRGFFSLGYYSFEYFAPGRHLKVSGTDSARIDSIRVQLARADSGRFDSTRHFRGEFYLQ